MREVAVFRRMNGLTMNGYSETLFIFHRLITCISVLVMLITGNQPLS